MSSYRVIQATSQLLETVLRRNYGAFEVDMSSDDAISFMNPTETAQNSSHKLSIWLYQVTENEFLKNQPRLQTDVAGKDREKRLRNPPLGLNLYYLLTPFNADPMMDHLLLGKTMQILYENAILSLYSAGDDIREHLSISLCRLSLEELTRIWEALKEPYRLSVCYQVRVNRIDPVKGIDGKLVVEREDSYREMPEPEPAQP
jgi:hypothetical protein